MNEDGEFNERCIREEKEEDEKKIVSYFKCLML